MTKRMGAISGNKSENGWETLSYRLSKHCGPIYCNVDTGACGEAVRRHCCFQTYADVSQCAQNVNISVRHSGYRVFKLNEILSQ